MALLGRPLALSREVASGGRGAPGPRGTFELERIAALEAEDSRTDVGAVIAGLPEVERRALELKYFEGLSYQEIARCMGLSFSKVDHLIRQARARLGHRMGVRRRRHEGDL